MDLTEDRSDINMNQMQHITYLSAFDQITNMIFVHKTNRIMMHSLSRQMCYKFNTNVKFVRFEMRTNPWKVHIYVYKISMKCEANLTVVKEIQHYNPP